MAEQSEVLFGDFSKEEADKIASQAFSGKNHYVVKIPELKSIPVLSQPPSPATISPSEDQSYTSRTEEPLPSIQTFINIQSSNVRPIQLQSASRPLTHNAVPFIPSYSPGSYQVLPVVNPALAIPPLTGPQTFPGNYAFGNEYDRHHSYSTIPIDHLHHHTQHIRPPLQRPINTSYSIQASLARNFGIAPPTIVQFTHELHSQSNGITTSSSDTALPSHPASTNENLVPDSSSLIAENEVSDETPTTDRASSPSTKLPPFAASSSSDSKEPDVIRRTPEHGSVRPLATPPPRSSPISLAASQNEFVRPRSQSPSHNALETQPGGGITSQLKDLDTTLSDAEKATSVPSNQAGLGAINQPTADQSSAAPTSTSPDKNSSSTQTSPNPTTPIVSPPSQFADSLPATLFSGPTVTARPPPLSFSKVASKHLPPQPNLQSGAVRPPLRPPPVQPVVANRTAPPLASSAPTSSSASTANSSNTQSSSSINPPTSSPSKQPEAVENLGSNAISTDEKTTTREDQFDPKLYGIPDPFPEPNDPGFIEATRKLDKLEKDRREYQDKQDRAKYLEDRKKNPWLNRAQVANLSRVPDGANGGSVSKLTDEARSLSVYEQVFKYEVSFKPIYIEPRGLINQGNMCYLNGILQPLVFCVPFRNLLMRFDPLKLTAIRSTPLLENIVSFVQEFRLLDDDELARWKLSGPEYKLGSALNPNNVYTALRSLRTTYTYAGRQEDAEEFLGFVLDGLHEEFLKVVREHSQRQSLTSTADAEVLAIATQTELQESSAGRSHRVEGEGNSSSETDVEWMEMGPKKKTKVTRETEGERSPIADIFVGKQRSEVRPKGKKPAVTIEPFKSLPLDIAASQVSTIVDALEEISRLEQIEYTDDNKAKIETTKQTLFEKLPPVLIFHLKRFVFDKELGDVRKLNKFVAYPLKLEIDSKLLCRSGSGKTSPAHYTLTAVVYHHGQNVQGGHYTCEVWHPADKWLRIDDEKITEVKQNEVLADKKGREAYLLFYTQAQ